MATRKLGDVAVGELVTLSEHGKQEQYRVVHQGIPSDMYDSSCDGTWLLREFAPQVHCSWGSNNTLETSTLLQSYQNYISNFDSDIQNLIKEVKIPYRSNGGQNGVDKTGANGLVCKCFPLSAYEIGAPADSRYYPNDGSKLDYFLSDGSKEERDRRLLVKAGQSGYQQWYTRSPNTNSTVAINGVDTIGYVSSIQSSSDCWIRPTVILTKNAFVDNYGKVFDNKPPTVPSTINIPETIRGGSDAQISWSAATDPEANLDGYIVERSYDGGSSWAQIYQGRATSTTTTIPFGTETVMFRVLAYDTYGARSGWRTSSNKTVVNNRAPAAPPSISVPLSPSGGDKLTITWTASTDADGNLEGYELERQWDGAGAFTQIYKGAGLSYQDSIPKGEHTSVVYRVRAYDTLDAYSSYTTAPSRTIDNNTAPVITSDLSGDLGEKAEGFTVPYTVTDAENQAVTVTEKVGSMVKRTYSPTLGKENTFEITGEYFQRILNGAQTVQIVATDSAGKSSTLELTFTKKVHKAVITLEEPLAVEEQITVAVLAITGKIPADATQLIELTNNGNDPEPVWEDATADVKAGRNHPFTNKTQTNGWAFNFRVTVERGESGEDGNIVSIQGGFQ